MATQLRRGGADLAAGVLAGVLFFGSGVFHASALAKSPDGPFAPLLGWWAGEGRLGFKSGEIETVKCRATYRQGAEASELKQVVRCASASGQVEVRATIRAKAGKLSGRWKETKYGYDGQLEGTATENGFRVGVRGDDLRASMAVIVKDDRHGVEIQFHGSSLIGMSMIFTRGAAKP